MYKPHGLVAREMHYLYIDVKKGNFFLKSNILIFDFFFKYAPNINLTYFLQS